MKFTLEQYRFFPYIAWTLIIGFVVFTYTLTVQLSEATIPLEAQTHETASAVENGV